MTRKIMVTGGAGFIGSNLIRLVLEETDNIVFNIDKLTYASNPQSLTDFQRNPRYQFEKLDVADARAVDAVFQRFEPDWVVHLAAESHVDRSIDQPSDFIQTNIVGTFNMLTAARSYWDELPSTQQANFRFVHVSTDEVYGSLAAAESAFIETDRYDPHSPYSASKAGGDHLVRSWHDTYGLPAIVTHSCNNYGPYQHPEKLIPLIIVNAVSGQSIPIYGDGKNIRDWLFVGDHAEALLKVMRFGGIGNTYNIGDNNEITNFDLAKLICTYLDELLPVADNRWLNEQQRSDLKSYSELITFVADRPGHDRRYAIDASKIQNEIGWTAKENLSSGLRKTVEWYLTNEHWWRRVLPANGQLHRQGNL